MMTGTIPELDVYVASLIAVRPDENMADFEEERDAVAEVQDQLREHGIEIDLLAQPGTEIWENNIETLDALYQLSLLATYLEQGRDIGPVLEEGPLIPDDLDPAITNVWNQTTTTRFPNLVNLQGIQSYYLPVEFGHPVWLPFENESGEDDAAFFGSAVKLQQELTELADLLRDANVPPQSSAFRCLNVLREAADQSMQHNLPIIIW